MASNVPVCGVCDYRHVTKPAIIWCNECDEGLCGECQDHHSSSKASRGHDTVSIEDYTNLPSEFRNISSSCTKHGDKYTTYCRKHDCPCCKRCVIESHNKCVALDDINDVIRNVKSSSLIYEIDQTLSDVLENLQKIIQNRKDNMKDIRSQRSKIEDEIQQARIAINKHLDRIQADLLKKLTIMQENEQKKIKDGIALLEENEKQVAYSKATLTKIKAHASDLQTYVAIKELEKSSSEKIKFVRFLTGDPDLKQINLSWKVNEGLGGIQRNDLPFGKLFVERESLDLHILQTKDKQAQIYLQPNTRTINDISLVFEKTIVTNARNIRGCTSLPCGKTVFVDNEHRHNKLLICRKDGSRESEIKMNTYANDVAYNKDDNTVLVTLNETWRGTISVVDVDQRKISRTIPCEENICSVTVHNGTAIYSTKGSIKMIRLDDGSRSTILDKRKFLEIHVTTFKDNIYYTDLIENTVTCCDLNGKLQLVFKNEQVLKTPGGISVDNDGNMFVTGVDSQNVVVISHDGKHYRELLTTDNGLYYPIALDFDCVTKKLLVANRDNQAFLFSVN